MILTTLLYHVLSLRPLFILLSLSKTSTKSKRSHPAATSPTIDPLPSNYKTPAKHYDTFSNHHLLHTLLQTPIRRDTFSNHYFIHFPQLPYKETRSHFIIRHPGHRLLQSNKKNDRGFHLTEVQILTAAESLTANQEMELHLASNSYES